MIEDITMWTNVLNNFGFPILITLYLLIRFENILKKLSSEIEKLVDQVKQIKK